jgi:pyrimidine operon attenuation protein/uracil phosphoribosyltransferase
MKLKQEEIGQMIAAMAAGVRDLQAATGRAELYVVGIHTGGVWVAERLARLLDIVEPLGELNIAFYRDDFSRIGIHPLVKPSNLPVDIDDRHLLLVDDVLQTGRTVRAAMNEIFDWGRPASISLAVLVERDGRELPIRADVVGRRLDLKPAEHVKLCGPEPLALEITST